MPRDLLTPPSWAPKAKATDRGWEDPVTGELLVSQKGLKSAQAKIKKANRAEAKKAEPKTMKAEPKKEEVIVDEGEKEAEKPVARPKAQPKRRTTKKRSATKARKPADDVVTSDSQAEGSVPEE